MASGNLLTATLLLGLVAALCDATPADFVNLSTDCSHMGKQHNFHYGQKSYRDRILYSDNVSLQSKLARYNSVDMEFPRGGSAPLGTISYIEVLDKRADGTGGCVYIADGGVGQTRVRLHFKTLWNHGLDFQVNVYGH